MKRAIYLEARLTHTYVGTCADMDRWAPIGNARTTRQYLLDQGGDDACDGCTYGFVVSLTSAQLATARAVFRRLRQPRRTSFGAWMTRAIEQKYSRHGCHHDHDCCGCASYHADVRRTKRGEFSVSVSTSYNF